MITNREENVKALTQKYGITLDNKRLYAYTEAYYEFPLIFEDYLYSLVNMEPLSGDLINVALYIDGVR